MTLTRLLAAMGIALIVAVCIVMLPEGQPPPPITPYLATCRHACPSGGTPGSASSIKVAGDAYIRMRVVPDSAGHGIYDDHMTGLQIRVTRANAIRIIGDDVCSTHQAEYVLTVWLMIWNRAAYVSYYSDLDYVLADNRGKVSASDDSQVALTKILPGHTLRARLVLGFGPAQRIKLEYSNHLSGAEHVVIKFWIKPTGRNPCSR